ncbi:acylphosphatase [Vibrio sp. NTOU-M3]|uniref:acylphosphatase n=1 Tax=Vibrio sp. NTOU-M3 TaxID=3234954 RepID=UPI00349F13B2
MVQKCEKFIVSGLVQGVGFRYHTSYEGMRLGLVGYAKNLNNGDVEVIVNGDSGAIEQMAKWLEVGPRTARVDTVTRESIDFMIFKGFEIL